jgi:GPCR-chaperone
MEIDHDAHQVFTETIQVLPMQSDVSAMQPSEDAVAARLTAPIVTTYIDTEKITFERLHSYSNQYNYITVTCMAPSFAQIFNWLVLFCFDACQLLAGVDMLA